jgi:type IV secretory pathway VirJ component
MVVWVSGDGGWGKLERMETKRLAAAGIPTLGMNSLLYFLHKRTPQTAAADLAAQIERQGELWRTQQIIFVGFSFGADIGPFIVRDLPPALRARVSLAAFLSPSKRANTRVTPASWLGIGIGPPVWPVMRALAPTPVLCIGGAGVFNDICPDQPPAGMTSVRLAGGHELVEHYDEIARLLIAPPPVQGPRDLGHSDAGAGNTSLNQTVSTILAATPTTL